MSQDDNTFRPGKRPEITPQDIPLPTPNMPTVLQNALTKQRQAATTQDESVSGPRIAYTGNQKLDELLAGIKETVFHYEEVELPSRGKFYDGVIAPTNGVIHVRCMTGEEEEIMGTQRYIKKGQAINMIFSNCVRENIIPDQLLTADRTWLLIYLRGISHGPDYEATVKCTECGQKFSTDINLDSIMVKRCPDDFGPSDLSDVLPRSKYRIRYRLPIVKDEVLINEYREKKMKSGEKDKDDSLTYRASLLIYDIEGLNDQPSIQTLISKLPIQDVAYIRTLLNDPPFGVDTKINLLCEGCGEEFQVEMPMDINFFFPKPKKAKYTQV